MIKYQGNQMINKKKKNDLTILIGRQIAGLRKKAGMSQQDVEDKATRNGEREIKYRTLSLIEQGYGEPKLATLVKIAQTLDVPVSRLLEPIEQTKKESVQLQRAVRLLEKLDDSGLKMAVKLLEVINKQENLSDKNMNEK